MQRLAHPIAFLSFAVVIATSASPVRAENKPVASMIVESDLIGVLTSDAPAADKALGCKRLAIFGGQDAVPALAPLLADPQLASWARIALEAIPGPEADAALRNASGALKGRLLIGTINSIGVRRDAAAVDALAARLEDEDRDVSAAAAVALGRIAAEPVATILAKALSAADVTVRSAAAEGCLLCAEQRLAEGDAAGATKLYDQVRQADVPKPRLLEATRGAILARQTGGIPLLREQFRSDDRDFFRLGLTVARELSGSQIRDELLAEIGQTTPEKAALLLGVLADSGATVTSPVVLHAALSGPKPVRYAALGVLARQGDVSCVPTLLAVAVEKDAELAEAAKAALAALPGANVDAAILSRLDNADAPVLPVLIDVVGLRRLEASGALFKAADHSNAGIRRAALTALGATLRAEDLPVLLARITEPRFPQDATYAHRALRTACIRMPDREACAEKLAATMPKASVDEQIALLEVLGAMGGPQALQTMGAAARHSDVRLQDASTRLLGEWMTIDAAPTLLSLAQTPNHQYRVRALRGYLRLARQFKMSGVHRAEMCNQAIQAAERDEERRLVLKVLEIFPCEETLALAVQLASTPTLHAEATSVTLAICQKLKKEPSEVQRLLGHAGGEPLKLEILEAKYGAGSAQKDVTDIFRGFCRGGPLVAMPSREYNAAFGGDPARGVVKQLTVKYRMNGKAGEATFSENAPIVLPVPE